MCRREIEEVTWYWPKASTSGDVWVRSDNWHEVHQLWTQLLKNSFQAFKTPTGGPIESVGENSAPHHIWSWKLQCQCANLWIRFSESLQNLCNLSQQCNGLYTCTVGPAKAKSNKTKKNEGKGSANKFKPDIFNLKHFLRQIEPRPLWLNPI